eukprot:4716127-Pyramimonas_sp.AAC.1
MVGFFARLCLGAEALVWTDVCLGAHAVVCGTGRGSAGSAGARPRDIPSAVGHAGGVELHPEPRVGVSSAEKERTFRLR